MKSPAQIRRIARWFDALPISPPGVVLHCPLLTAADIKLVFRSPSGARVASAQVPAGEAGICDPIAFDLHGKRQTSLVDTGHGESFARRLQDLLGVRLLRKGR